MPSMHFTTYRRQPPSDADQARQLLDKLVRIRALLYAGKPDWRVLGSIVVR